MIIKVKVKPQSKKESIEKISNNAYQVFLHEIPEKGKANKTLIKLLADYFDISVSRIIIMSGFKSRNKILSIDN